MLVVSKQMCGLRLDPLSRLSGLEKIAKKLGVTFKEAAASKKRPETCLRQVGLGFAPVAVVLFQGAGKVVLAAAVVAVVEEVVVGLRRV